MRLIFLGSVCFISSSILNYSIYYMEGEKNFLRFVYVIIIFVLSIWFLIIRPNLVRILLGWDGLGLRSYILVIFYQRRRSESAGIITILRNRIGDVAILIRIGLISRAGRWNFMWLRTIGLGFSGLIILAGITKRAQIPFSAWLPAAMAAPTPVSSLVHSSTLVTAGVYLLIRFRRVVNTRGLRFFLLIISITTRIIAGVRANLEVDIKKVVALSTLSQLGLIIIRLRIGIAELAFFHLIIHAMFKSTLFISVGVIIHRIGGTQDSRKIRGLSLSSPLLSVVFGATNIALSGFPFIAGYFSKDIILEGSWNFSNYVVLLILILSTGLTVSYRIRVVYSRVKGERWVAVVRGVSDLRLTLVKSMRGLFLARLIRGFFMSWVMFESGRIIILRNLEKYRVILVIMVRGLTRFHVFERISTREGNRLINTTVLDMWFSHFVRSRLLKQGSVRLRGVGLVLFDKGWLEFYGGKGGQYSMLKISSLIQLSQKRVILSSYLLRICLVCLLMVRVLS